MNFKYSTCDNGIRIDWNPFLSLGLMEETDHAICFTILTFKQQQHSDDLTPFY